MNYTEILSKVSKDTGFSEELLKNTYYAYWGFIREVITNLPLKDNLTEEEFNRLKTNISIPSLGKLNCTYKRYLGIQKRNNILKNIKNDTTNKD